MKEIFYRIKALDEIVCDNLLTIEEARARLDKAKRACVTSGLNVRIVKVTVAEEEVE